MPATATFTVDGFAGPGITLAAEVIADIAKFEVDVDKQLLKLTDSNGKVTNIAITDAATFTVTVAAFRVTAVTIAN